MERECVRYFKENTGFKRLFQGIREKYRSLGTLGGTVYLNNLTKEERDAFSGLFRKDYYSKNSASIKVENVIKSLAETKFQGVDFEKALIGYFGGTLLTKKEERDFHEADRATFFDEFLSDFVATRAYDWLVSVLESRSNAYRVISAKYKRDREGLREILSFVMKGLNELSFDPMYPTRLALFSSTISKDPHTFDLDGDGGNLLLYGIIYFLKSKYPQDAEDKAELLYRAGIIKDEISNYTTLSGLIGYKNGKNHLGWKGFYEGLEPLQVSLWNLSNIDYVMSPSRKVFVFENPTVFSEVLQSTKSKNPSLICTYGQIKLASLVLLDKLKEHVDFIYYSGDFDPEGLLIADRLKDRYGEKLVLWRYGVENYEHIKSDKAIEASRMKKLDKIKSPEIKIMAYRMKEEGYAAYQELLTERYVEDIIRLLLIWLTITIL
jgi:uncharacterized protein (TIGR02679 family)